MRKVFLLAIVFLLVAAISYAAFEVTVTKVYPGQYVAFGGECSVSTTLVNVVDTNSGIMAIANFRNAKVGDRIAVQPTGCVVHFRTEYGRMLMVYERI